ncbi:histidine kinase [Massilia sp. METH4]|uniref:sensor histidine kinase n=1 Tax=Massilia sp. METH4 TaxID=3123041 RepID=UPI0030CC9F7C
MIGTTSQDGRMWRGVALAWLALGLFDATQTVVSMHAMGMEHAWVTLFLVTVASWLVWALWTPVVLRLLRRFPLPARDARSWCLHGVACLAAGAAWAAWSAFLEHTTDPFAYPRGPDPFLPLFQAKFMGNLVGDVIIYGAIVALSITFEARSRLLQQQAASARLAELLAQTRLTALRRQLEPHFIFNALNAITALVREQRGDEAIAITAGLGDLLRRVTDDPDRQFVTLADELSFIEKYLAIQQTRFAERLRCRIDVPAALLRAQVPEFIVQPLVENAIKHGIARRARGGELRVSAAADGARLAIQVYNDGPPLSVGAGEGVGLSNSRQRLHALYGEAQALTLRNEGDGVLAMLVLPYREEP